METIEATYRIVTPMFIGGANQDPSDGIRPPSFKGALRFWWRALNWGKYQDLTELHKKECDLFGSAAKDGKGGQGVFLLFIQEHGRRKTINDWPTVNTGAGYLAYGILESKGGSRGTPVPHRIGIVEGHSFTAQLKFRRHVKEDDIQSVRDALEVIGLLGGLGSRSRRGLGSLSLLRNKPMSLRDYQTKLNQVFQSTATLAPFTAFTRESFVNVRESTQDAKSSLNSIGKIYKEHRSLIINERNKRISFGLPLQGVDESNRRASPMFIHIQELVENGFATVVSYMPAGEFHHVRQYQNINFNEVKNFVERVA